MIGCKNERAVEKRQRTLGFTGVRKHQPVPEQDLHISGCQNNRGLAIAERSVPLAQFGMRARIQLEHAQVILAVVGNRREDVEGFSRRAIVNQKSG